MPDTDTSQEDTDQLDHESGETTEASTDEGSQGEQPTAEENPAQSQIAALRREAAGYRTRLRESEAEAQRLTEANASELDRVREEARAEARAEALAEANARVVRAEVVAAAAGRLRDPADALQFLDLSSFAVNDDGEVDREALAAAVGELVKTKPYLTSTRDPDFGAREPAKKTGKTMDDLLRGR